MSINLKAIRERCEKATDGPWLAEDDSQKVNKDLSLAFTAVKLTTGKNLLRLIGSPNLNAEFIAHARTDIPALLDWIERAAAILPEYACAKDSTHEDVFECLGCVAADLLAELEEQDQ